MTPDEKHKEYFNDDWKRGYKEGKEHSKSSPETITLINNMDKQMIKIEKDIDSINEKLEKMPTKEEMSLANKELVEEIFSKANEKYAYKLTERIVYAGIGMALLYLLNNLLEII